MFLLNLSLPEFLAMAGAISGLITLLYFFDRSKRKKRVSTLRFWAEAVGAQQQKRRKSVRQPWSLLLQLLSILLLLLAIAHLQLGTRNSNIRNTILLLDTSSATGWKNGNGTVLDREKVLAEEYLSRLNPRERVMVVRVDSLASPATAFTADRAQLRVAIEASTTGYSALNIQRALTFARQAGSRAPGAPGELTYIGPQRIVEPYSGSAPRLRVLPAQAGTENCGIRGVVVTRSEEEDAWRALVTVRNDGSRGVLRRLSASFGTTAFAVRRLVLHPQEDAVVSYQFVARSAGRLTVRLEPGDDLPSDDEASVMVPASRPAKVLVYSSREEAWRPLLGSEKSISAEYQLPQEYRARPNADLVILDRFAPRERPHVPSLWLDVPADGSPLPVKSQIAGQVVTQWNADSELGAGLRARDVLLPKAKVFQLFDKDFIVAAASTGPVAVVRPASDGDEKLAVVGFDLLSDALRYKVSSPILFANLMRWLVPQSFRAVQVSAEPVGLASIVLDESELRDEVHVTDTAGGSVPFLLENRQVKVFVEVPTVVNVVGGERERSISMVLPEIAMQDWKVPLAVPKTVPGFAASEALPTDLWRIMACFGGMGLLVEWLLFGQQRPMYFKSQSTSTLPSHFARLQREREFVGK